MIRFSKYIYLYALISLSVLIPGTLSLFQNGLVRSIDFSGGTLVEYRFDGDIDAETIRNATGAMGSQITGLTESGENTWLLRLKTIDNSGLSALNDAIISGSSVSAEILRRESVGPVLGSELLKKTLFASLLAISAILAYVAWAFKNIRFGVAAVIALIHDLLVVLGVFSLLGKYMGVEIDTLFVTAILTTMSFSVHDTIVVFDRIREYRRRDRSSSFADISDRALTETMNRSLTNSSTIIFMLFSLILMGGDTVRWFVVALLVGTVSGTYSSPFVATPILVMWHKKSPGR